MLKKIKKDIVKNIPQASKMKSSHLTEVIAKSFGYKTHASFLASNTIITENTFWEKFDTKLFIQTLQEYGIHTLKNDITSIVNYYKKNSLPVFSSRSEFLDKISIFNTIKKDNKNILPDLYAILFFKETTFFIKNNFSFVYSTENIIKNNILIMDYDEKTKNKIKKHQNFVLNNLEMGENLYDSFEGYLSPYMSIFYMFLFYNIYSDKDFDIILSILQKIYKKDEDIYLNYIKLIEQDCSWDKNFNFIILCGILNIFQKNNILYYGYKDKILTCLYNNGFQKDNLFVHYYIDIMNGFYNGESLYDCLKKHAEKTTIPSYELLNLINNVRY